MKSPLLDLPGAVAANGIGGHQDAIDLPDGVHVCGFRVWAEDVQMPALSRSDFQLKLEATRTGLNAHPTARARRAGADGRPGYR